MPVTQHAASQKHQPPYSAFALTLFVELLKLCVCLVVAVVVARRQRKDAYVVVWRASPDCHLLVFTRLPPGPMLAALLSRCVFERFFESRCGMLFLRRST